jgi:hypothetical protein
MHRDALALRMDRELGLGNFHVILLNATASFGDTTDLAQILQYEPIQTTGGYAPQAFTYTAGSSTYDSTIQYQKAPDVTVQFTEPSNGTGYDHTHVALMQGRGATANKVISSVNASTDQITCLAHGLSDGARAFVRSTGSVPGGLTVQRYFVKTVSTDVLELHSTSALNSKVNITSTGSGTLYLQYASGTLIEYSSIPGRINPASPKSFILSYQLQ